MSAGTTQYCGLWKMRSMSCCNSPARSKYLRNWIERGRTETVCRMSVRTCTLGRGTARAAQSPTPASSTRWRPASTSPPSCSPSSVLSTSYIAHHFCIPSTGILGNFVSVYVLSRSDCTRFGNLLIMLAYMDIRYICDFCSC